MNYGACVVSCVCSRSCTAAHGYAVADLVFDTCVQTTGQLNGSWIVLLGARDGATLGSKLVHTHLSEQQAAYAAGLQWRGQNQRPFIPLAYLHALNHIWKSLASFHLFIWLQMNAFELNAGFLNKQKCPARVRCFRCGTSHASFM